MHPRNYGYYCTELHFMLWMNPNAHYDLILMNLSPSLRFLASGHRPKGHSSPKTNQIPETGSKNENPSSVFLDRNASL